jgi:hypothetical protein
MLVIIVDGFVNFSNENASQVVQESMPWKFHHRVYLICAILIFVSASSFVASYYEVKMMFTINNIVCTFAIAGLGLVILSNEAAVVEINEQLPERCSFIIP